MLVELYRFGLLQQGRVRSPLIPENVEMSLQRTDPGGDLGISNFEHGREEDYMAENAAICGSIVAA